MKPKQVNEPPKQKTTQSLYNVKPTIKIKEGVRIGRLLILERIDKRDNRNQNHIYYRCLCTCGNQPLIPRSSLLAGRTYSCGCQRKEKSKYSNKTHGLSKTRTYRIYHAMMQRCYDKTQKGYPRYGGNGIGVCERWRESFENFFEDMGECPSPKYSIDRIDNNKGYSPDNCRWATINQQARNTRKAVLIKYHGEERPLADVADEIGMYYGTLYYRIFSYGWTVERAINTPIKTSCHRKTKYQRKNGRETNSGHGDNQ